MSKATSISGPLTEPTQQGSALYYRCNQCGREAVGSPENILHTDACTERDH